MTHLRQKMLDELQRRNYSQNTVYTYLHAVEDFSRYFHRSPDRLGPDHIRQYQAYLFRERKLQAGTIACCTAALRFLYVKTLRRPYLLEHIPFPKRPRQLPVILSPKEIERVIESAENLMRRTMVMTLYSTGIRCSELKQLVAQNKLQFHGSQQYLVAPGCFATFLRQLFRQDWVVYAKPPFGGAEHVLNYLARYTHRVAISNHRLVAFENDRVSFRWRDYAHGGKKKVMTVSADEFLRRFLLHVLPKGLVRIRHFGYFANRNRNAALQRCRQLLGATAIADRPEVANQLRCPACTGTMLVVERLSSAQLYFRPDLRLPTPQRCSVDSS